MQGFLPSKNENLQSLQGLQEKKLKKQRFSESPNKGKQLCFSEQW